MLKEILDARQVPGESPRRCFTDADLDLTVWIDDRGEVLGFELCYDKGKNEHALRWERGAGYQHDRVDDGEGRPLRHKGTPVLVPDGAYSAKKISRLFEDRSREIDQQIATFIIRKLAVLPF